MLTVPSLAWTIEIAADSPTTASPDWEDVSDRWRGIDGDALTITRGRHDETGRVEASHGLLTLDNSDRHLDPRENPDIRPWMHCRVRVDDGSGARDLFRGFVEAWEHPQQHRAHRHVRARLTCALAWLANTDVELHAARTLAGVRVAETLSESGWPSSLRAGDDGVALIDPVDGEADRAMQWIHRATDAEDGIVFVAPDGTVTFHGRHARLDLPSSVTLEQGEYRDVTGSYDDTQLVNVAKLVRGDGREVEHVDQDSVGRYGRRVRERADLDTTLTEMEALGMWAVDRWGETRERLEPVTLQPLAGQAAFDAATQVDIGERVTIERHWLSGSPDVLETVVEGVEHRVSANGWRTVWRLSPHFGGEDWLVLVDENDEPSSAPTLEDGVLAP